VDCPHPGLVDYIESGQLIVPWKEHKSFLREESDKERLEAHNESHGYRRDSPVDQVGKHSPVAYVDRHGTLTMPFDEAVELARNFCMSEPATILAGVESTEREWSQQAQRGTAALTLATPVQNPTVPPVENPTDRRGDEPQFVVAS
jgi:hypothetical protein